MNELPKAMPAGVYSVEEHGNGTAKLTRVVGNVAAALERAGESPSDAQRMAEDAVASAEADEMLIDRPVLTLLEHRSFMRADQLCRSERLCALIEEQRSPRESLWDNGWNDALDVVLDILAIDSLPTMNEAHE